MTQASDQILEEDLQGPAADRGGNGAAEPDTAEPGLGELFGRLARNARTYAGAEMELLQTSYMAKMRALRVSALGLALAAVLSLAAIVSLLVGLMVGFAPLIGPFAAAFAVSIVALAFAAAIGLASARNLRRHFSRKSDEEPPAAVVGEEENDSAR